MPKATWDTDGVDFQTDAAPPSTLSHSSLGDPSDLHLPSLLAKLPAHQCLHHRQIGVWQVDVPADQPNGDLFVGMVHPVRGHPKGRPVNISERQIQTAYDVKIQPRCRTLGMSPDGRASAAVTTASWSTSHIKEILLLGRDRGSRSAATNNRIGLDADRASGGPRSAGWAWSSVHRKDQSMGPARHGGRSSCLDQDRGAPVEPPRGKGKDSMSPTVPPISVITTSISAPPMAKTRSLISLVMCGIFGRCLPNSHRDALWRTWRYTCPVVLAI